MRVRVYPGKRKKTYENHNFYTAESMMLWKWSDGCEFWSIYYFLYSVGMMRRNRKRLYEYTAYISTLRGFFIGVFFYFHFPNKYRTSFFLYIALSLEEKRTSIEENFRKEEYPFKFLIYFGYSEWCAGIERQREQRRTSVLP